jgi:hypothetical protein
MTRRFGRQTWGGARWRKFGVVQESVIDSIIWALIKEDPTRSCVQLNLALYDTLGVRVGTRWL